jgi:uncharacterized protein
MMELRSEARVATAHAARYLGQLRKHFAHRVPATFEGSQGRIEFAFGICDMQAADGTLVLRATATDAPSLDQVEEIVARHLERFAFRDRPEIRWARGAAVDPS